MKKTYITFMFFIVLAVSIAMMMIEDTSGWWFAGIVVGGYGFIYNFIKFINGNQDK